MTNTKVMLVLGACVLSLCQFASAQMFQGLGRPAGQTASEATSLSADGSTVVGWSFLQPWQWSANSGLVAIGAAPSGFVLNTASGVSGDGSVIVGSMNDGIQTFTWRWTQATGVQRVVGMGGSSANISADGTTIVGELEGIGNGAARWTQATGAVPIGPITGVPIQPGFALAASATSADGSVVVGSGSALIPMFPGQTTFVPFVWTAATGAVGLLDQGQFVGLPDGITASDVSADGSTIVSFAGGIRRWTQAGGFELLSTTLITQSTRISGDGRTITSGNGIWQENVGQRSLTVILAEAGCTFSGWTGLQATDVSFDGRALCGFGTNPQGQTEAWHATIPAPGATGVLMTLAGTLALHRRRREK